MPRKKIETLPKLPRGMGTYTWRDEAHTRIQFQKFIGEEPNRKRKVVYGTTVKECNQKMDEAEKKYISECRDRRNRDPHNAALTLKDAVRQWLVQFKQPGMKSKSYDTIEGVFERYLKTADFANKQVEQVIDVDIQNWLSDINDRLSDSTTKKCYSLVNMYFEYYYVKRPNDTPMRTVKLPTKDNKIELDDEGLPISPDDKMPVLTDDEIERFELEAARPLDPGKVGYKHGLLLIFAMWTYMRDGELIALQWRDIDFEKKRAYIYKDFSLVKDRSENAKKKMKWELDTAKTKSGLRYVYLCDRAIDALQEYKKRLGASCRSTDYIFVTSYGNPVSNSYLNDLVKRVLKRADIDKDISLHGLRHTGISYFKRHDVDPDIVSKMAGHSSRDITDRVYYSITPEQYEKELEKINRNFKNY